MPAESASCNGAKVLTVSQYRRRVQWYLPRQGRAKGALLEGMPWLSITAALTPLKGRGAAKDVMERMWAMLALLEKMPWPMCVHQEGAILVLLEETPWPTATAALIVESIQVSLEATRRTTLLQACVAACMRMLEEDGMPCDGCVLW